ncbi:addiction module protein [Crocinitomix algicola]|uniref:addiction module protein n=1 Tax=Crocinitomix algicola TaxID=1740263 RepID=UPI000872F68D|nr:addiction module protein [Crocinitomix algicola]
MKQVTVDIPDGQFDFVMELLKKLGLKAQDNFNVPLWQQEEVTKRLKHLKENPDSGIDFDKAMDDLEKKYGL